MKVKDKYFLGINIVIVIIQNRLYYYLRYKETSCDFN